MNISRRSLLTGAGAASLGLFLAGCGGGPSSPNGSPSVSSAGAGSGSIRWWDHFAGLQDYHTELAASEGAKLGVTIDYVYNNAAQATEALQLANQSQQLPDVFSNVVGIPLAALVAGGWLHEIELSDDALNRLPSGSLVEGVSVLDGKVYGLPAMSGKQYHANSWYNIELLERAGVEPPKSYGEFLDTLKAIAALGDGSTGVVLALGADSNIQSRVEDWAQSGGFEGWQGIRYRSGEYAYDDDAYVEIIEVLKEANDNGWVTPGSNQFNGTDARERWTAGGIGYFISGIYTAGSIRNFAPDFVPNAGAAGQMTPDGQPPIVYRGAPSPTWFVAKTTGNPEAANGLLETFTSDEYQLALMEAMDQPGINLALIDQADVTEPYRQLATEFETAVLAGPVPVVKNPEVSEALARMAPVTPNLGNVVQNYLGGQTSDLRGELKKLSDALSGERERAVEAAVAEGANVSLDDWAFPDWTPGVDYIYS